MTHNLAMLLAKLTEHGLGSPPGAEELTQLTPFGAALRYDDIADVEELKLEAAWAMACADRTLTWAERLLSEHGGGGMSAGSDR